MEEITIRGYDKSGEKKKQILLLNVEIIEALRRKSTSNQMSLSEYVSNLIRLDNEETDFNELDLKLKYNEQVYNDKIDAFRKIEGRIVKEIEKEEERYNKLKEEIIEAREKSADKLKSLEYYHPKLRGFALNILKNYLEYGDGKAKELINTFSIANRIHKRILEMEVLKKKKIYDSYTDEEKKIFKEAPWTSEVLVNYSLPKDM